MVWINRKGLHNVPGVPAISGPGQNNELVALNERKNEIGKVKEGLRRKYTFTGDDKALEAKAWLYAMGDYSRKIPSMAGISLEEPKQFMMSWSSFGNTLLDPKADDRLGTELAAQLTDASAATENFWPQIAKYGTAFNLLGLLRKVTPERLPVLKTLFGYSRPHASAVARAVPVDDGPVPVDDGSWKRCEALQQAGRLYEIDLELLKSLSPRHYKNHGRDLLRFNPATVTLLEMTDRDLLLPVLIWVFNPGGPVPGGAVTRPQQRIYSRSSSTSGAWLYALQAAKSSVTLYGIWLGHVYHWHIVTAAMVRTFDEQIKDQKHPIQLLLAARSQHLLKFNGTILGASSSFHKIAPPTSVFEPEVLLKLLDDYAALRVRPPDDPDVWNGREFFDDDPYTQLANNGLDVKDFTTTTEPWDLFPVAKNLTRIFDFCHEFVDAFIRRYYPNNDAVAKDAALQNWMRAAADPAQGNIRGLPKMDNPEALRRVLTSQIYRVTAHGISRLPRSADPWLTFVANFPPCLQRDDLPAPDTDLNTRELLKYLPNIGTIAEVLQFYYIFAFAKPFQPLMPPSGADKELYFPTGPDDLTAQAMIYRGRIMGFGTDFQKANTPPGYATSDRVSVETQWERSIEL